MYYSQAKLKRHSRGFYLWSSNIEKKVFLNIEQVNKANLQWISFLLFNETIKVRIDFRSIYYECLKILVYFNLAYQWILHFNMEKKSQWEMLEQGNTSAQPKPLTTQFIIKIIALWTFIGIACGSLGLAVVVTLYIAGKFELSMINTVTTKLVNMRDIFYLRTFIILSYFSIHTAPARTTTTTTTTSNVST